MMSNRRLVQFTVNGNPVEVAISPRQTLLEVIRDELDLTGSKEGCSNGNCGSCTVEVDGVSINSCCALGVEMDSRDVNTIEGLATGNDLHPIQQAYMENGGFQCGICTPGFIISTDHLLKMIPQSDGRGNPPPPRRQPLPLHRLRQDRPLRPGPPPQQ